MVMRPSSFGSAPDYPKGLFGLAPLGTLTCENVEAKNLIARE